MYTRERAPSNSALYYFDHIPTLLDMSNSLFQQNQQRLRRIQELCQMRRQLQQQQKQTQQNQTHQPHQQQQHHIDNGATAALNYDVIVISDDDDHFC